MLGKGPYYFALTRKFVAVFGTLFNDITIEREYGTDDVQSVKVPLTYASQDKMLARVFSDPTLDKKAAAITPAMSFTVGPPRYDAERKLQSTLTRCITVAGVPAQQFIPVPYNLEFKLFIYAREEEDGLRVLEQILPFFTPSYTVTVIMDSETDYKVDVPIVLDGVEFDNESYGDFLERRKLIWTLTFTLKGEFLGPKPTVGGPIIRIIHANFRDTNSNEILEEVHIEPGLTANGDPTTVRADSIDVYDINPTDDYGFIIEINEGPDPHP